MKVRWQTADGITMDDEIPHGYPPPELFRACMNILRLNGEDLYGEGISTMPAISRRKYVLWTRDSDGTFVYREDL